MCVYVDGFPDGASGKEPTLPLSGKETGDTDSPLGGRVHILLVLFL